MAKTSIRYLVWLLFSGWFFGGGIASGQNNVTTYHNDIARTGANLNEIYLTPANVNTTLFGRLFSAPVDGYVYAQPLYLADVLLGSGTIQAGTKHNIVFVATEHDSVYAFDADSNGGANSSPLWKVTLLDAAHGARAGATPVPNGAVGSGDIVPEIGITGTPVIDPATGTLYLVGKTKEDNTYVQRLHALDVATGLEKFGGPATIAASVEGAGNGSSGGVLTFDPLWENNRPGLLLVNGVVYIGYAAHGDNGPWHGWLLAYSAATLRQTGVWCTSPNSLGSGIWMSGAGIAADTPAGKPYGRIFTVTGNGALNAGPPYSNSMSYGDSIVRLDLTNGKPTAVDAFTPREQAYLNASDEDQGSGGIVLLPDAVGGGAGKHQLVQLGKSGRVFILQRENLGGYSPSDTTDPEQQASTGGLWGSPAYWNGNIYIWGQNDHLKAFRFVEGAIESSTPVSTSKESATTYSPSPAISANGTEDGIVWSLKTDNFASRGEAILFAHDAKNVATLLYSSAQNPSRDSPGSSVKFATPIITNGKVYVGTATQLSVFGLLKGVSEAAPPVISPPSESFTAPIDVMITSSAPGAKIYYTTDGTPPSTKSALYAGAISVATTQTVSAIASVTGSLQSPVATETYTLRTQTLEPVFNPPPTSYQSAQTIVISDATQNSTIYYTVDGSTPSPGVGTTKTYTSPVLISATTTLKAVAKSAGLTNSSVSSGLYTISLPSSTINFANGFSASTSSLRFNGSTDLDDTRLQLTSGKINQAGSAFYVTRVNVQSFTTDFNFQLSNAGADGITFTIQNTGLTALGKPGAGLGYGASIPGGTPGIAESVALKFDTYNNEGEGATSTGIYVNGVSPTTPSTDLSSAGIDLHSGTTFSAHVVYDGATMSLTITDPVKQKTFSKAWIINIPGQVGATSAYVGFTGGTGGQTSSQKITSWTFASTGGQATAVPTFTPGNGTYLGTQIVTIKDATSGAAIYYTTNGSLPTTSSTKYTGPLSITSTQTIKAIAKAPANPTSGVGSATLTIESRVASPSFSPAGGTYGSPQSIKISTISTGATIYYTIDGSIPTKTSNQYKGPIAVSSSKTITAIAVASGYFDSNVSAASYKIASPAINYSAGFSSSGIVVNGSAKVDGTRLRLTDGSQNQAGSVWYSAPVNIQAFSSDFTFQLTTPNADGIAFVIQNAGKAADGPPGGGLGYGPDLPAGESSSANAPIAKSIAVKFDLYNNDGEGPNSTGLYENGASPTKPAITLGGGVNLHNSQIFKVHLSYNGTTLNMTITDTSNSSQTFMTSWPIKISSIIGSDLGYVGFTGGTGGQSATQDVLTWTLSD
jgi:Legume lectin domain/Chitobiase/beta-hexosaminidase C-terminal domain/Fn3 associated